MVLEEIVESPLDFKEIQPVHSEGDQPWDSFGVMMMQELEFHTQNEPGVLN